MKEETYQHVQLYTLKVAINVCFFFMDSQGSTGD